MGATSGIGLGSTVTCHVLALAVVGAAFAEPIRPTDGQPRPASIEQFAARQELLILETAPMPVVSSPAFFSKPISLDPATPTCLGAEDTILTTGKRERIGATAQAAGGGALVYDNRTEFPTFCLGGKFPGLPCNSDAQCGGGICVCNFAMAVPGQGVALADDMLLVGTNRRLTRLEGICVWSPPGTPNFRVTIELWTDNGSGTAPAQPIPGARCEAILPSGTPCPLDAAAMGRCDFGAGPEIVLPGRVWMVLTFSTNFAGWVIAQQAETGFTSDFVWLNPPGGLFIYEGLYAGQCGQIFAEPVPRRCLYKVECLEGDCSGCALRPGDECVEIGFACVDTCPGAFTRTCGDGSCCLRYDLIDCRVPTGQPACPAGAACTCDAPPPDLWRVWADGSAPPSSHTLRLPADFFHSGSDPFEGEVPLSGLPLDPGPLGDADTIVQRTSDPVTPADPPGANGTVDVEIVDMKLVSTEPIMVTSHGGQSPTSWTVEVELSNVAPPAGTLTATKITDNAGTFDLELPLQPRYTFRKVDDPLVTRILDTGLEKIAPLPLQAKGVPFVHELLPGLDVLVDPEARFVPGIAEITLGEETSQVALPFSATSMDATHTWCTARPRQKKCIYRVRCIEGTCDDCPLRAGDSCFEFNCVDTCPDGFSSTCGTDCCIEYELVACRLPEDDESACPEGDSCACKPTDDPWRTWTTASGNENYQDMSLPADFFGPGSDPFVGRIEFEGAVSPPAGMIDTDTVVRRLADPVRGGDLPGTEATIPVEIVELHLQSIRPIIVTFHGGQNPQPWDVTVELSDTPAPLGTLSATKTHDNGGVFDSTLFVQPKFIFQRRELDCRCGDVDRSGAPTNLVDFAELSRCLGSGSPTTACDGRLFPCADLDASGVIDLRDVAIFQLIFGQQAQGTAGSCFGDPGVKKIILDTAGLLSPIELSATNVPFVHERNPDLNTAPPSSGGFLPGIRETVPGDPESQVLEPFSEDAAIARHTVCRPRRCLADLDIDSDNDNASLPPDRSAVEDAKEPFPPGKYLCLNDDDDDNNHIRDFLHEPLTPAENDAVPLVVELRPNTAPGLWRLTYTGQVQVYDKDATPPVLIPSGAVFLTPLNPNPKTLLVEGVQRSTTPGDVVLSLDYDCDGDVFFELNDTVVATVIQADLDIDSDNTSMIPDFPPQRDDHEDEIEDHDDKPGRIICVNNDDDDRDGVPDFLDGFNRDGTAGNEDDGNAMENDFVRMVFEVPPPVDLTQARIRVSHGGHWRIWTVDGDVPRNPAAIDAGGHLVAPGTYDAADLGLTNAQRSVPLWLEGLSPSAATGDARTVFEVDPDGEGPAGFVCADAVRATLCRIEILDRGFATARRVDIGHWGSDEGTNSLSGISDSGGSIIGTAGGGQVTVTINANIPGGPGVSFNAAVMRNIATTAGETHTTVLNNVAADLNGLMFDAARNPPVGPPNTVVTVTLAAARVGGDLRVTGTVPAVGGGTIDVTGSLTVTLATTDGGLATFDGGAVKNNANASFIDLDPDRFYVEVRHPPANGNRGAVDTLIVTVGTVENPDAADDDVATQIELVETGNNTGVFRSEALLLMSPDMPPGGNPDDDFAAHSARAGGTVADDARHDRTHRTGIEGRVRADVAFDSGECRIEKPICNAQTVRVRVHVLNEQIHDLGADGAPGTGDAGEGNGMCDAGEFVDVSGDGLCNTVLGTQANAAAIVAGHIRRANIAWAQACIKIVQQGGILFEDTPNLPGGMSIIADGDFDFGPGQDEEILIEATAGAGPNVAEVFWVPPMTGATGLASTPNLRGGVVLNPAALRENTYLFIASDTTLTRRTLAHELGHGLTNRGDIANPFYIFFPANTTFIPDTNLPTRRHIQHRWETRARTCRAAGNSANVGNRLLDGCP